MKISMHLIIFAGICAGIALAEPTDLVKPNTVNGLPAEEAGPLEAAAEDDKDLQGSETIGFGFYPGVYPGYGLYGGGYGGFGGYGGYGYRRRWGYGGYGGFGGYRGGYGGYFRPIPIFG